MNACDDLMERIENALLANDGDALSEAWYALYAQHPAKAIRVAEIMRPLAAREKVLV